MKRLVVSTVVFVTACLPILSWGWGVWNLPRGRVSLPIFMFITLGFVGAFLTGLWIIGKGEEWIAEAEETEL